MAPQIRSAKLFFALFMFVSFTVAYSVKTFNVRDYGANPDGRTDNQKAFVRAWSDACNQGGGSIVEIPKGVYMLGTVEFSGPCKGPMMFLLNGDLKAQSGASLGTEDWLGFRYIRNFLMTGGGTIDGQGPSAWPSNKCDKDSNCKPLPISVKFNFVANSRIENIRSVNSKKAHFSLFACNNVNISRVEILAPADSPNTDGIKMGSSSNIRISNSKISTGDDCIAIIQGSSNIDVTNVVCGPGHGISVGSLGKSEGEKNVNGLSVKKCVFRETDNGLRIKTWESLHSMVASNFLFQDIFMDNVRNPIIIDQTYCPHPPCNAEAAASHVQIQDVTYRNIWGTSSSQVAVTMECSQRFPCKNIVMTDINLSNRGPQGPLKSICSNVQGRYFGRQNPPSCF